MGLLFCFRRARGDGLSSVAHLTPWQTSLVPSSSDPGSFLFFSMSVAPFLLSLSAGSGMVCALFTTWGRRRARTGAVLPCECMMLSSRRCWWRVPSVARAFLLVLSLPAPPLPLSPQTRLMSSPSLSHPLSVTPSVFRACLFSSPLPRLPLCSSPKVRLAWTWTLLVMACGVSMGRRGSVCRGHGVSDYRSWGHECRSGPVQARSTGRV